MTDVIFLGYPDGRLVPSIELRRDISRQIRHRAAPSVWCASRPSGCGTGSAPAIPTIWPPGEASVCAVYPDARNPFAHPELLEEGLEPYTVAEIWMMAAPRSNRAVDITDTFDRKIAALRRHRSQVGEGEWLDERIRTWVTGAGQAAGLCPRDTWPSCSRSSWPPDRPLHGVVEAETDGAGPLGRGPARAARGPRAPGRGARRGRAACVVVRLDRGESLPPPGRARRGDRHGRRHGGARHRGLPVARGRAAVDRRRRCRRRSPSSACAWAPSSWPPRWGRR